MWTPCIIRQAGEKGSVCSHQIHCNVPSDVSVSFPDHLLSTASVASAWHPCQKFSLPSAPLEYGSVKGRATKSLGGEGRVK